MGSLILIVLVVGIVVLLYKKFNVSKRAITITSIILITIGIVIMLIGRYNVLNKIAYERYQKQPTITQEERENAIAIVKYANIIGIDAMSYETYYIYKDENNKYLYYRTSSHTTIEGPQEEKINKKGNINSRNELERIINNLEKKVNSKSTESEYVEMIYNGTRIEKEELLNKLFN